MADDKQRLEDGDQDFEGHKLETGDPSVEKQDDEEPDFEGHRLETGDPSVERVEGG